MSTPKRIHYVPAGYQKAWAAPHGSGKRVWVYPKDGKPPRYQSTKDTALESNRHSPELENALNSYDSGGIAAIRQVFQGERGPESVEDARNLLGFMALLMTRTVAAERELQKVFEVAGVEAGKQLVQDDKAWARACQHVAEANPGKTIDFDTMRALGRDLEDNFKPQLTPKVAMLDSLMLTDKLFRHLCGMGWNLMRAGQGRFITSDNPVIEALFHPGGRVQLGGGIAQTNGRVFFPLSPRHCLVLSHQPLPNFVCPVSPAVVDSVNAWVAICAESMLISEVKSATVAKLAIRFKDVNAVNRLDEQHLSSMFSKLWAQKTQR